MSVTSQRLLLVNDGSLLLRRYLIPCSHIMISQQKCVRDPEMYSRTPEKLISLMPVCSFVHCSLEGSGSSGTLNEADELQADKSATYVANHRLVS